MRLLVSALPLCLALALPLAAKADTLNFTLATPTELGRPGTTLTYIGTLSAPITNSGNEYLNGDSINVASPLVPDDSAFFINTPLFIAPGASFTGILFSLNIPTGASGFFPGSFSILGGSTANSQSILATTTFQANVTPEPSSLVLLGTGLLGVVGVARRKFSR